MIEITRSFLENKITENYEEFIAAFGIELTDHECYFKKTINDEEYEFNIHYNSDSNPAYKNQDIQVISVIENDYVEFIFIPDGLYKNYSPLHSRLERIRREYKDRIKEGEEITQHEDWMRGKC